MTDHNEDSPFKRKGFIFGAVLFVVLFLAAAVIGLTSSRGGGDAEPAPLVTSTPTSDAAVQPSKDDKSVCGLPGYGETGTLTAAPEATWTFVGTMAAPSSDQAGPGMTGSDGVRSCYAHTVEGALTAAANMWAMGSDARLGKLVTQQLTVEGPGRDAALARESTGSGNGLQAQIAGFKVLSYSASDATIDVAFRLTDGQLASSAIALRWDEGDWRVLLTDEGDVPYDAVRLTSLGSYIPWAGGE
jgi:hypothetical protein